MPLTDIEWTDRAWPVVNGCRRVSPGCENCWAERLTATRLRHHPRYKGLAVYTENGPRWTGERRLALDILDEPLRTKKPQRWFVANKGDLFSDEVTDEQIAAVFGVMAATPQHTYQILTKRPERMARWFVWIADPSRGARLRPGGAAEACFWEAHERIPAPSGYAEEIHTGLDTAQPAWPLMNVWLGVSVEDQQRADERIPCLLRVPAAVRFISVEPLLGAVDLRQAQHERDGFMRQSLDSIDWVIVGGESGPGARPCDLSWIRAIVAQCRAVGVPVFVKQLGARPYFHDGTRLADAQPIRPRDRKGSDPSEWPEDLRVREFPEVTSAAGTVAFDHHDVHRAL